jgi:hypothetical protein
MFEQGAQSRVRLWSRSARKPALVANLLDRLPIMVSPVRLPNNKLYCASCLVRFFCTFSITHVLDGNYIVEDVVEIELY